LRAGIERGLLLRTLLRQRHLRRHDRLGALLHGRLRHRRGLYVTTGAASQRANKARDTAANTHTGQRTHRG
jgi:hypothetical protein